MNFTQALTNIDDYHAWLSLKNKSQETIKSYLSRLNRLEKYFNKNSQDNIEDYFRKNPYNHSPKTIHCYREATRSFLKFCNRHKGTCFDDPFEDMSLPKPEKDSYVRPTDEKLTAVYEQAKKEAALPNKNNPSAKIYLPVMILLMQTTGVRRCEICNIKVDDINMRDRSIKLIGKGRKSRTVLMLNKRVQLWEIQKQVDYALDVDSIWLFPSVKDPSKPISLSAMAGHMLSVSSKAGAKGVGFHDYRRSFSDWFYREYKNDIHSLADLLGHEDIETTRRYVSSNISDFIKKNGLR